MSYKIGSFNMKNIGQGALAESSPRDLRKIAEIIREEQFDVVALQEVLSEGKAFVSSDYTKRSIIMELGSGWDFVWASAEVSPRKSGNGRPDEEYAFLWNTRRLRLATVELEDGSTRTFYPRMLKMDKSEMRRWPYYARFTPTYGPLVEFRLICIHTYYGDDTLASREIRQNELDALMKDIYPRIADRRYGELGNGMPSYSLLLGDYNVGLYRPWKEKQYAYLKADENDIVESTRWGNRKIKTVQDQYTTLKEKQNDSDEQSESRGYNHDYDHFSYEERLFEGVNLNARRIDAVRKYCNDDFAQYRKKVSDHIPIMMEVELR